MTTRTQEDVVIRQFGDQAAAYLTSPTHAAGADLAALTELVRGHRDARVLDLGCGGGHVTYAVAPEVAQVVACDLSGQMLSVVARAAADRGLTNVITQQAAAERLPFGDASFDFVLSRYSAHHWRDLDMGFREAARVLRPGGMASFVDVVSPGRPVLDTYLQAVEVLRDTSHVRDRSRAEWEDAVTRAGLVAETGSALRLRLEFRSWIERMRTPASLSTAISALQQAMSDDVRRHFAIEPDGTFTVDVLMLTCKRP
jgi:SAM-dependent methyltransferase